VIRHILEKTIHRSNVICFFPQAHGSTKTCHRVVRTSIWSISYSGELCNKNCIVKTSETWQWLSEARPVTLLGPIS